jgi:hypothetical protein
MSLESSQVPSPSEVLALVKAHPGALQFKNSLRYIQGGTNVSLERMISHLDSLLASIYAEGMSRGMALARSLVGGKEVK